MPDHPAFDSTELRWQNHFFPGNRPRRSGRSAHCRRKVTPVRDIMRFGFSDYGCCPGRLPGGAWQRSVCPASRNAGATLCGSLRRRPRAGLAARAECSAAGVLTLSVSTNLVYDVFRRPPGRAFRTRGACAPGACYRKLDGPPRQARSGQSWRDPDFSQSPKSCFRWT